MHRYDLFGFEQAASHGGLAWSHGKYVPYGQKRELGPIEFLDQSHIGENVGVAGEIDPPPIRQMQHVARGLASIDDFAVVQNSATVDGVRHSDAERPHLLGSAFVHGGAILHAFRFQPVAGFVDGDYLRGEFRGQGHCVMDVVEVAVRDEDCVYALERMGGGIGWIAVDPGIQNDNLAGFEFQLEHAVA